MLLNLKRLTAEGRRCLKSWGLSWRGLCWSSPPPFCAPNRCRPIRVSWAAPRPASARSKTSATALFTTYLLPFEIASFLLLAAIIGRSFWAKKKL